MNKKLTIISVMLSLFVFLGAALVPIRAEAASSYAESDVIHGWSNAADITYLDYYYVDNYEIYDSGSSVVPDSGKFIYKGSHNRFISFYFSKDVYYSGTYYLYLKVYADDLENFDVESIDVVPKYDAMPEGVVMASYPVEIDSNSYELCLLFNFNNFNIAEYVINLPLQLDITLSGIFDNSLSDTVMSKVPVYITVDSIESKNYISYTGDLKEISGEFGDIANQNQQIIDGINENTGVLENLINNLSTWFEEQKTNINTRFSELTSNLTSWYNGLTATINNGFDRLLNSYSGTGTTDAANKFDDSAGELETVETDLTGITNSSIDNYSTAAFDTGIISSLGPSLVYVVTWFTNFWNMGGIFTSLLNVGLALFVAFFILRLHGGSK